MLAAIALAAALLTQAEAAPPEPAPAAPPVAQPPPAAPNAITVAGRFSFRVGDPAKALGPAAGFSLGGSFERRYVEPEVIRSITGKATTTA